jgi:hypothetical protein
MGIRCVLPWASVYNSRPPMPTTCSAKPNSPCAQSGTTHSRCSTAWPSQNSCGQYWCVPPQPYLQLLGWPHRWRPSHHSPYVISARRLQVLRLSVHRFRQGATSCVENSAKKRFVASWLATRLTPQGTASTTQRPAVSPHQSIRCFPRKHPGLRRATPS